MGGGTPTPGFRCFRIAHIGPIDSATPEKVEALAGGELLKTLRSEHELEWAFLSPSLLFEPGERTCSFPVAKNELLTGADGQSWISTEDYATASVAESEQSPHKRERFTVGY
jgi:uncharacterized protein